MSETDPLLELAWECYKHGEAMPEGLTEQERAAVNQHIESFKARDAGRMREEERQRQDKSNEEAVNAKCEHFKTTSSATPRPDYIRYLWDTALAPLPDDPFLAARKRDQAIMRALANGEVLPTTKHHLFSRAEKPPLNMDERRTIKEAQTVLEKRCPKYVDAFKEYDQEDLTRQIEEMEAARTAQIEERREIARLAHHTEVQDHLFFALAMIHKFCPDPKIRAQIEDGTREIKEQWEAKYADKSAASYAEVADRTDETCQGYVKLLNDLYGMDYAPAAAKPDEQGGARSIEQNRITNEDIMRLLVDIKQNGVPTSGFTGEAKADISDIQNNASKAADNTVAIIDELAVWREWIENGGKSSVKKRDARTRLLKDMRDAIWDMWQRFNDGDADCELPNGTLRRARRSYKEFYEKYGTSIVYTSRNDGKMWTLKQLCRNVDELETAIDSANKSAKRDAEKAAKRKTDKKIR